MYMYTALCYQKRMHGCRHFQTLFIFLRWRALFIDGWNCLNSKVKVVGFFLNSLLIDSFWPKKIFLKLLSTKPFNKFQPFKYSLRTPLAANQLFQFHSFRFGLRLSIECLANILQSITTKSQTIKKSSRIKVDVNKMLEDSVF